MNNKNPQKGIEIVSNQSYSGSIIRFLCTVSFFSLVAEWNFEIITRGHALVLLSNFSDNRDSFDSTVQRLTIL